MRATARRTGPTRSRFDLRGVNPLATPDEHSEGPFYHGTKVDLKVGDLITPGFRSNYDHGMRTSAWVYMSATLPIWAAELAQGDGPGRIYIVEPTGAFADDPDLTDKRFAGNPTRSYRSRDPLRVIGEVRDWQGHSPEEIQVMRDALDRHRADQALRVAQIPTESDLDRLHAQTDAAARVWAPDGAFRDCVLLMLIRGVEVELLSAMTYVSEKRGATRIFEHPRAIGVQPALDTDGMSPSGRITEVSAWREGWAAVIESCVTEIGLSLETKIWVSIDATHNRLRFRVDADGPERSWRRDLTLAHSILTDLAHGEIWDFANGSFRR